MVNAMNDNDLRPILSYPSLAGMVYPKLAAEFADLGPTAMTTLVELMPELEPPEREILKMLLLHDMPLKRVAWSNQISEPNVLSWAALALLRLLPRMRTPV